MTLMELLGRRFCSVLIAGAVVFATGDISAFAQAREDTRTIRAAKIKDGIGGLGTGEEVRVELRLMDKSVVAGYISEAGDDHFVLTSPEIELRREVDYDQVEYVRGKNSITGVRISFPGERLKPFKAAFRMASHRIGGSGQPTETTSNNFGSKPFVVVLIVLAVGLILIGVELKKA
jgi:hypothetical protein